MKNYKAIVIEINEVPLKVLNHYQQLKPNSYIARLLQESLILKTEAKDVVFLRKFSPKTQEAVEQLLNIALLLSNQEHFRNWFAHCCYCTN